MPKETLIRLTKNIYAKYWAYIPDSDIVQASDGENYVYERAFMHYVNVKCELDVIIDKVERGSYPKE